MSLGVLIGVMGVLSVVAVYFWLVKSKAAEQQDAK
jgi:hypothetical protein